MEVIDKAINYLEKINNVKVPTNLSKEDAFRALMNITLPIHLSEEFYLSQDEIIKKHYEKSQIIDIQDLIPLKNNIYLLQGDITLIKADAIVNACNEKLLGCFYPLHNCIDNAIHSFAGLQVRRDLMKIMEEQRHDEENGQCKVTLGYNLPSKYIFHTVGPKIINSVTKKDENDLRNCYVSCLKTADKMKLKSLVFCSISTGLYGFPLDKACDIAIAVVQEYLKKNKSTLKYIVFDVFSRKDYDVYYQRIKKIN